MSALDSFYARMSPPEAPRPALTGRIDTEVAIIGGGLAGLSAAASLLERGCAEVVVLEARTSGWGASGRNAGSVAPGFALDPWSVEARVGRDGGRALFDLTRDAVRQVRARIDRHGIPCAPVDSGIVKAWWTPGLDEARREQDYLGDVLDFPCELWPAERTRDVLRTERYHHAMSSAEAFHFDPLAYVRGLAEVLARGGARLCEESPVVAVEPGPGGVVLRTAGGEVRARRVLCACGGYLAGFLPEISRAVLPIVAHAMVTAPLGDALDEAVRAPQAIFDSRLDHDYYRLLPGGRLLFGGGVSVRNLPAARVGERLRRRLLALYPQLGPALRIEAVWSGQVDYARHQMPMLAELRPGLWCSAGHGGHGLATTTLLGELFARAVVDGDDAFRLLAPYGPRWAGGVAGLAAAQLTYWYYQGLDALANARA